LPFSKIIIKINNIIYNNGVKDRPKLNITTKKPFRKQVIIPMSKINSNTIISQANIYVSNINRLLKGIKSEVLADFIHFNNKNIIITTNKATAASYLNVIKKYIKTLNNTNSNNVISP